MSQLRIINTMNSLETIAGGLYSIFVPIFLLTSGFSLQSIFIYLTIHHLGIVPFFILAAKSCERFGVRKTIFIRFFFLAAYFFALFFLDKYRFLFYLAPVLGSLQASFMYYPQHFIFASHAKHEEMGAKVASLYAWPQVVSIATPLISSFVAILFGFKNLFIASLLLYFITSLFAYRALKDVKIKVNLSWKKFFSFIKANYKHFKLLIIENIRGEIQGNIWPIMLFIAITGTGGAAQEKIGILSVGSFESIVGFIGVFLALIVGRTYDKHGKDKLLRFGFASFAILWLLAYKLDNPAFLYLLSIALGIFTVFISIPMQSLIYELSQKQNKEEFLVYVEAPQIIGRLIAYAIFIIFIANIKFSFLFAFFTSLLMLI